jgi:hypothetical protein
MLRSIKLATWAAAVLFLASMTAPAQQPLSRAELSKRGKGATVFVEARRAAGPPRDGATTETPAVNSGPSGTPYYGTAFCIHPSGLFVASHRVLFAGGLHGDVDLVLDTGLKTRQVVKARIVRFDAARELALLQAESSRSFAALELGTSDALTELAELVSFGFPTVMRTPGDKSDASLNVSPVTVTSLEQKEGVLSRVRLNTSFGAGMEGGPALDASGRVVAVMASGPQFNAGVNSAVPVDYLRAFLAKPVLRFDPPKLTTSNLHEPTEFQVKAVSFAEQAVPLKLELHLRGAEPGGRTFPMNADGNTYRVTAVPVPKVSQEMPLRLLVRAGRDSLMAACADVPVKIGDRELKLSELRRLRPGAKPVAFTRAGKALDGALGAMEAVPVRIGGTTTHLNLATATDVEIATPPGIAVIVYEIVASQADKEVERIQGPLWVKGGPDPRSAPGAPPLAELGAATTVNLAANVEDLAVGGSGRFLVLYLPKIRKLALFDAEQAKVVHYIPVAEDGVKFAAGKDKLVVILPTSGVIQRWSLATFEREASAPLPVKGVVKAVSMGSAANDLLLVHVAKGTEQLDNASFHFLSIHTLKIVDSGPIQQTHYSSYRDLVHVRAAPDGRVYGMWCTSHSPHGLMSLAIAGNAIEIHYEHTDVDHVVPGSDDRTLFTGRGLYTLGGKPISHSDATGPGSVCLPAQTGPYYLSFGRTTTVPRFPTDPDRAPPGSKLAPALCKLGDARPLLTLPEIEVPAEEAWIKHDFTPDKRIHLLPAAKLLVTIPGTNDRLVVRRFDIEGALDKAGIDYLVIVSRPPARVRAGGTFSYQVAAQSKEGDLKYKLELGPPGMAISPTGKLTWSLPDNSPESEVPVVISVRAADGLEAFQTFKINIRD